MEWWYPVLLMLGGIVLGVLALVAKRWYVFVLGMSALLGIVAIDYLLVSFHAPDGVSFFAYLIGGVLLVYAGLRIGSQKPPKASAGKRGRKKR